MKDDFKLLNFLWPFIKRSKLTLVIALFAIIISSIAALALPYITKVAIDSYIFPRYYKVQINLLDDSIKEKIPENFLIYTDNSNSNYAFINSSAENVFDKKQRNKLLKESVLFPDTYYVYSFKKDSDFFSARELKEKSPDVIELYQNLFAIKDANLNLVPESMILAFRASDINGLKFLALIFAVLMIIGYVAELLQRILVEIASQKISLDVRQSLLRHLFNLKQSFFDKQKSGLLTSRLTSDINNLSNLVKSTAVSVFADIFVLIGITCVLFYLNFSLALITLSLSPILLLLSRYFSKLSRNVQRDIRAKLSIINQSFVETFGGIKIIQVFRREKQSFAEFQILNQDYYLSSKKQLTIQAIFLPLVDFFSSIILAIIIWYGGIAVINDSLSIGVLAAFITYIRRFFAPIQDLAEKVNIFQSAFASLERITAIMDVKDPEISCSKCEKPVNGDIVFENISFRYSKQSPLVLKNINFTLKQGKSLALVGATGSGKSSIINLLLKFYEPELGNILIGNKNLADLDLTSHRKRIGIVSQDVYIYSGSVMDNLKLGRTNITDEMAYQAAVNVGADKFIKNLPNGYNEILGSGAMGISEGEKQLLACARALIDAPEIVIFDEATAFVDSQSEYLIQQALETLFKNRTSLTIAHRLATVLKADKILVFNKGTIVERGTHEQLISANGYYSQLANLQNWDLKNGF